MTDSQFLDFNRKWMDAVLPHLVDGGSPRHVSSIGVDCPLLITAATGLGVDPLSIWSYGQKNETPAWVVSTDPRHELLPLFKKRRRLERQQHFSWQAEGGIATNVWTYSRCLLSWIRRPERSTGSSGL